MLRCSVLVLCVLVQVRAESCRTPNRELGECLPLFKCIPLLSSLQKQTDSVLKFFEESKCPDSDLVCCGTLGDYFDNTVLSNKAFCGLQHSDDRFQTGSKHAHIDEFPWLASLIYRNASDAENTVTTCSGVLINSNYVLTAAQCLSIPNLELIGVRLGEYNTTSLVDCVVAIDNLVDCSQYEDFAIVQKIVHEKFDPKTGAHDIALLKINFTITEFSDFIRPICLPTTGTKMAAVGNILFSSGWGSRRYNAKESVLKKRIFTKLISDEECQEKFKGSKRKVTEDHVCTIDLANNTEFSCTGDAGAPVMFQSRFQWHVEGISSWGVKCGGTAPEVGTRVSNYLIWIWHNIKSSILV